MIKNALWAIFIDPMLPKDSSLCILPPWFKQCLLGKETTIALVQDLDLGEV